MEYLTKNTIIDNQTLYHVLNEHSNHSLCRSAFYKNVAKLIESERLMRMGKGKYVFSSAPNFKYTLECDLSTQVLATMKSCFGDRIPYVVYESTLLNRFLNHLIAHPTVIIEAPKAYVDDLFWMLKSSGYKDVLVDPSDDERYRYEPRIIVKTMVSKAPINGKEHAITAEKLIVDIVCDKVLKQFYESSEIPMMIESLFEQNSVRIDTIRTYAKRRNAYASLLQCLSSGDKHRFND